jgi:ribosome recycling factor
VKYFIALVIVLVACTVEARGRRFRFIKCSSFKSELQRLDIDELRQKSIEQLQKKIKESGMSEDEYIMRAV